MKGKLAWSERPQAQAAQLAEGGTMNRRMLLKGAAGAVAVAGPESHAEAAVAPADTLTLKTLAQLAQALVEAGYDPGTPIALVFDGDPRDPGSVTLVKNATWLKPLACSPLAVRGVAVAQSRGARPGPAVRVVLA